jgi:hypothetical protein
MINNEIDLHYNQIKHNTNFLNFLQKEVPDDFYDWKITVTFYIALHYIRAYACKMNVKLGDSHISIIYNLKQSNANSGIPVPQHIFLSYLKLYDTSKNARYSGLKNDETILKKYKARYDECLKSLESIKEHLSKNGIKIL